MIPRITKEMHEVSATIIILVSITSSALLFTVCVAYLWRSRTTSGKPVVFHVAAIAGLDFAKEVWSYVPSCIVYRSFAIKGDPPWCTLFFGVRWWLTLLSMLSACALTFGILSALANWQKCVARIRYSGCVILPLSFALVVPFWHYDVVEAKHVPMPLCVLENNLDTIVAVQLMCFLCFVVFVHIFALIKARRTLPGSVIRRSIRIASRYLVAFWLSFGMFALACFQHVFDPHFHWDKNAWWQWYIFIAWRLWLLNSLFNFVALWLHVRDVMNNRRIRGVRSSVALNTTADVIEVPATDHESWGRACDSAMAIIEAENAQNWISLGMEAEDSDDSFVVEQPRAPPDERSSAAIRMFLASTMPANVRIEWFPD